MKAKKPITDITLKKVSKKKPVSPYPIKMSTTWRHTIDLRPKKISHWKPGLARPDKKTFSIREYLPSLSLKSLVAVMILSLFCSQVINTSAYEAHIINVTARIVNDIPNVDPSGGQFCKLTGALVVLTTTYPGANIIFTLDSSDPVCGVNGLNYTGPFTIYQSNTLKARACHDGQQSVIVSAVFDIDQKYCPAFCGDGKLDPGEQCDDGNNISGDGCSATCQKECVPKPEICDGIDNDCDGIIDNNVFQEIATSSAPMQIIYETDKKDDNNYDSNWYRDKKDDYNSGWGDRNWHVTKSNFFNFGKNDDWKKNWDQDNEDYRNNKDKCGNIGNGNSNKCDYEYVDLKWIFSALPLGASTTAVNFRLTDKKFADLAGVEWWNSSSSSWQKVCLPADIHGTSTEYCDLSGFIKTTDQAQSIKLRIQPKKDKDCSKDKGWGTIEIKYKKSVDCQKTCGNGKLDPGEQCDDGNNVNGDGCDSKCKIEIPNCMKINEVYYNPLSCRGGSKNEWIELYNSCSYQVNLKNWYMVDNGGACNKEQINQNNPIPAGGFVVLAANASTWAYWPLIPASSTKIVLGGDSLFGHGLDDNGDRVFLYDNNNNLIDNVSWGTDVSAFNPSVPGVAPGHSISRKVKGVDTDQAIDWMDTYGGSTPPGPNPGTNPHDANGNLLSPDPNSSPYDCCPVDLNTASTTNLFSSIATGTVANTNVTLSTLSGGGGAVIAPLISATSSISNASSTDVSTSTTSIDNLSNSNTGTTSTTSINTLNSNSSAATTTPDSSAPQNSDNPIASTTPATEPVIPDTTGTANPIPTTQTEVPVTPEPEKPIPVDSPPANLPTQDSQASNTAPAPVVAAGPV